MTKKKRSRVDVEELIARPWCYYCERDFDDLKILISHQKAKHFKCTKCTRRLNTAGGLSVHLAQVHKETLTEISNAIDGRKDCGVEIFAMEGIPVEVLDAHKQRVVNEFYKDENARRAETGNPPPGGKNPDGHTAKKPKVETPQELKQRLAEHRARREAEKLGITMDAGSGANTPDDTIKTESQSPAQTLAHLQPSESAGHNGYAPQPFPGSPFGAVGMPQPPSYPVRNTPMGWPPGYGPSPSQAGFTPPGITPMPGQPSFPPPQSHNFPPHPTGMPPGWKQESSSPVPSQPPSAPKGWSLPPPAPGLPARPTFEPPQMKQSDYYRMHHGRGAPQDFIQASYGESLREEASHHPRPPLDESVQELIRSVKADVDKLNEVKGVKTEATENATNSTPATAESATYNGQTAGVKLPEPAQFTPVIHHNDPVMDDAPASILQQPSSGKKEGKEKKEAKDKKKKDKKPKDAQKLLYSDNKATPEEKMSLFSKYQFAFPDRTRFILDEAGGHVTGVTTDQDTVLDAQNAH